MEIVEVTSTSFPDAHELPSHGGRPVVKAQKAKSNNSGTGHKKSRPEKGAGLTLFAEEKKRAQQQTLANQRVLILVNGRLRKVRESDYRSGAWRSAFGLDVVSSPATNEKNTESS